MKTAQVRIPWKDGLHARPAASVVKHAHKFHSEISLKFGDRTANARSILNILLLCASMGSVIEIEACGDDEDTAVDSIQRVFDLDW